MEQPLFELIFEGQIVEGQSVPAVQANMAQLFKASEAQIAKMFGGSRVVLKNKLDKATALKYQAVLKKNGAVVKIALMSAETGTPPPAAAPVTTREASSLSVAATASPAPLSSSSSSTSSTSSTSTPASGPQAHSLSSTGRLPVAGDKVEAILEGKQLDIAPVGIRLGPEVKEVVPHFDHLDEISIAPVGADLVTSNDLPPPPAPDVSHISIAPVGSDMGQLKKNEKLIKPDISHIKLED